MRNGNSHFFYFQYFPAHCGAAFLSAFSSEEKVLIGEGKVIFGEEKVRESEEKVILSEEKRIIEERKKLGLKEFLLINARAKLFKKNIYKIFSNGV